MGRALVIDGDYFKQRAYRSRTEREGKLPHREGDQEAGIRRGLETDTARQIAGSIAYWVVTA